ACTSLTSIGVPPNWFSVNWKTGKIGYSDRQGDGSRDLTFDASRVMWRMGLDAALGSERAKQYLLAHPFLLNYWQQHHKMPTGFTWKGKPIDGDSTGFQRGGVLVLNHIHQPTYSREQYRKLFAQSFHAGGYWFNDYNEYLHSVIWFSLYSVYALDTYPTSTILAKNAPSRPQKLESNQSVK
ncbi:MAG: hypothetical protein KTR14_05680, partial [Vampirovibrio sp.]|nr:hypothetical protein [Vampirovibrio sp.]